MLFIDPWSRIRDSNVCVSRSLVPYQHPIEALTLPGYKTTTWPWFIHYLWTRFSMKTGLNSLAIRFGVICVPTSLFVINDLNRDRPCFEGFSGSLLDLIWEWWLLWNPSWESCSELLSSYEVTWMCRECSDWRLCDPICESECRDSERGGSFDNLGLLPDGALRSGRDWLSLGCCAERRPLYMGSKDRSINYPNYTIGKVPSYIVGWISRKDCILEVRK